MSVHGSAPRQREFRGFAGCPASWKPCTTRSCGNLSFTIHTPSLCHPDKHTTHNTMLAYSSSSMSAISTSAPAGQSALHNILSVNHAAAPQHQQRCVSESSLVRNGSSLTHSTSSSSGSSSMRHSTRYYDNKNTTFMMINRSGGATVKAMIPAILARCEQAERSSDVTAPEEECYLLAHWAVDAFYKVVIASNGGIAALIRAMQCFPNQAGLQECCCKAIANLCAQSTTNQGTLEQCHGVRQVIAAMQYHASSVAVQSAACEALASLCPDVLWRSVADSLDVTCDLLQVLQHAKDMYLHPIHRSTAERLLQLTVTNAMSNSRRTC
jgi:hypothetical protein